MNEMNEKEFAQGIARVLDKGLNGIGGEKLVRLQGARQKAMAAYREPVAVFGLATVSGHVLDVSFWVRKPLFWLPMLAIVAAVAMYTLSGSDDGYDDVGELDAKLLTGELPIDAFLDKDFSAWVKESTQ